MLRSQAIRAVVRFPQHSKGASVQWKRANSQAAYHDDTNNSSQDSVRSKIGLSVSGLESAIVRPAKFPDSMRDLLAILRVVERKYGLISEFKCNRDYEVSNNYQSFINVTFRHTQLSSPLPQYEEEFHVTLPPTLPRDQEGGIGLADLEGYLGPTKSILTSTPSAPSVARLDNVMTDVFEESEAELANKTKERVMTCIIRKSKPFFTYNRLPFFGLPRLEREAVNRQFLNWGGFHDFPPLEKDYPLPDEDFSNNSKIEHFRMRHCLRQASRQLDVPNPYEHVRGGSSEPDWEPLLGPTPGEAELDNLASTRGETQKAEPAPSDAKTSTRRPGKASGATGNITGPPPREETQKAEPAPSDAKMSTRRPGKASGATGNITGPPPTASASTTSPPPTASASTTSPLPTASVSTTFTSQIDKKELDAQLLAARLLAQQVMQGAKQKQPPALENVTSVSEEDPLLEQPSHSPEKYSRVHTKESLLEQDTTENVDNPTRSQLEQDESLNGGMLSRVKSSWRKLF